MNIAFASSDYYHPFDHNTPKLGGSETMLCNMALQMKNYFNQVIVFNHRFKSEIIDDILYKPDYTFNHYIEKNTIDILIIFRDAHFTFSLNQNVKKYFIWCQDFICRFGAPRIYTESFGGFLLLSDFHIDFFKNYYNLNDNQLPIFKLPNYIEYNYILSFKTQKLPFHFIYSSFFNRGAEKLLLDYWPKVIKHIPNAKLSLCCDIPDSHSSLVKHPSIIHTGRIPKDQLYIKMWQSEFFFYPSTFEETYCITALEAQACECICIHNGLAALSETINNKQILISDNLINDILNKNYTGFHDVDYLKSRTSEVISYFFYELITLNA